MKRVRVLCSFCCCLTVYFAKNQRLDSIELYIRGQVEILPDVLVNLKKNERFTLKSYYRIKRSLELQMII